MTLASADNNYLMWNNVSAVKVPDNTWTLIANLRQVGFDNKYKWSWWGTLAFSLGDFALYGFSFMPFLGKYWQEYDNAQKEEEDASYGLDGGFEGGEDGTEPAVLPEECGGEYTPTYDEWGCDQCSLDIDGIAC